MTRTALFVTGCVVWLAGAAVRAQGPAAPPAPWRGAGPTPCVGADGGIFTCPPAPKTIAIRAGRLFDSKSGQTLTNQVIIIQGERITDAGSGIEREDSRRR